MLNLLIIIFKYFPPDKQSHENLTKRFSAAAEITVCYFSFCSLGPDIHTSCSNWIGMGLKSCHNSLHLTITRCVDATWNCKRVHWRDDTVIVDIVPRTKLSVTHHHSCNHSYCCRRRNSRHLCSSVSHSNLCIRFAAAGLGTCTSRSICIGACRRVCRSSHHLHWRTKNEIVIKDVSQPKHTNEYTNAIVTVPVAAAIVIFVVATAVANELPRATILLTWTLLNYSGVSAKAFYAIIEHKFRASLSTAITAYITIKHKE